MRCPRSGASRPPRSVRSREIRNALAFCLASGRANTATTIAPAAAAAAHAACGKTCEQEAAQHLTRLPKTRTNRSARGAAKIALPTRGVLDQACHL
jgi:hypothetical protein